MQHDHPSTDPAVIQLPRPTVWPLVLAIGVTLIVAGMVTSIVVAILGLALAIAGIIGWFFEIFPHEAHEDVPVSLEGLEVVSTHRTLMERPHAYPEGEVRRKILPIESFRFLTGVRGGIAGGTAMVVPATIFSLLKYHSLWYAVNLLAAGGFVSWAGASDAFLSQFHLQGVLAGFLIQGLVSLLVGMLYGAMLPMFPRYPILTAGAVVPLLFTGIVFSALGIVSPILNARIDWFWFIISQITFGLVCGFVVNLQAKVRNPQFHALPFTVRAGIHSDQNEPRIRHTNEDDSE